MQRALAGCEQLSPLALPHSSKWRGSRRLPRPLGSCWCGMRNILAAFAQRRLHDTAQQDAIANLDDGRTVGRTSVWFTVTSRMHDRATNGLGRNYIDELASTSLHSSRLMTASVRHARTQQTRRDEATSCVAVSHLRWSPSSHPCRSTKRVCIDVPCSSLSASTCHAIATGVPAEASRHHPTLSNTT